MGFSGKESLIIGGGSGMGLEAARLLAHAFKIKGDSLCHIILVSTS